MICGNVCRSQAQRDPADTPNHLPGGGDCMIGFFVGFFAAVIAWQLADRTSRMAGDECLGDCERCTAHCVGYHCYLMRSCPEDETD